MKLMFIDIIDIKNLRRLRLSYYEENDKCFYYYYSCFFIYTNYVTCFYIYYRAMERLRRGYNEVNGPK